MAKKASTTGKRAPGPMGAAPQPQWSEVSDPKKMKEMLQKMAAKMPAEHRREFIRQGMQAIEVRQARAEMKDKFKALMDDLEPAFKKHGITSRHLIVNLPLSSRSKKLGQKGWASNKHAEYQDGLELIGILACAVAESSKGFGRVSF